MAHADYVSRAALVSLAEEIGELLDGAELAPGLAPAEGREWVPGRAAGRRASTPAGGLNDATAADAGDTAETGRQAELVETFAIWTLDARLLARGCDAAKKSNAKKSAAKKSAAKKSAAEAGALNALACATGHWHHQIKVGGRAAAFARSSGSKLKLDSASLSGLFVSPLARKIEEAVVWIDGNEAAGGDDERDPVVRLLVVPSYQLHVFWLLDERENTSEVVVVDAPARFGAPARGGRLIGEVEFFEFLHRNRPIHGLG